VCVLVCLNCSLLLPYRSVSVKAQICENKLPSRHFDVSLARKLSPPPLFHPTASSTPINNLRRPEHRFSWGSTYNSVFRSGFVSICKLVSIANLFHLHRRQSHGRLSRDLSTRCIFCSGYFDYSFAVHPTFTRTSAMPLNWHIVILTPSLLLSRCSNSCSTTPQRSCSCDGPLSIYYRSGKPNIVQRPPSQSQSGSFPAHFHVGRIDPFV
ncbi:unnamed protein product, partial [Brassica oleracea var. botrytis]